MPRRSLHVIDLLNDFLDQLDEDEAARLIQKTNELVASFRNSNLPVIWVRQQFEPDLSDAFLEMKKKNIEITIRGSRGAEICAELDRDERDLVIVKKRYSAFFRTALDEILEQLDVKELTICGVNTHACIRMSAIDAYQRDFEVVIATDCVSSYDQVHGDVTLRYLDGKISQLKTNDQIAATCAEG